ncbi:hypothetical protein [Novacetimonas pomaceti]|uniref:hypothetical protein n=1 Tax=Novacetimonas pomaceti TaxID=2021998 RepID=UPI0010583B23|nr:hypothetical protein [Novacetimonas pomaceti]
MDTKWCAIMPPRARRHPQRDSIIFMIESDVSQNPEKSMPHDVNETTLSFRPEGRSCRQYDETDHFRACM